MQVLLRKSAVQRCTLLVVLSSLVFTASGCSRAGASEEDAEAKWQTSAHADVESRSFTRWNDEVPPEIPTNCAKCHSTHGYQSYLGADGSTPGEVSQPAHVGTTIECDACHNEVAEHKTTAAMPSDLTITGLGQESNCIECHQGRASSAQLVDALSGQPPGEVSTDLTMPRLHNNPAGATYYGTAAQGGGQYDHQTYLGAFYHGLDNCTTCHDSHDLNVRVANCSACHLGANTIEGVRNIRLAKTDYDGDADISEGIAGEIETMQRHLLATIRLVALATEGADGIDYDGGWIDASGEPYTNWTPELLHAAYNYEYVQKDPGVYSHNPRYVLQLLYDSIEDLGGNVAGMTRPES